MSYSFGTSPDPVPVAEVAAALTAARDSLPYLSDLDPAAHEQIDAALGVIGTLASAVVPSPDSLVYASISGHANPGHQITDGWANDILTLSVGLAYPPTPAPVAAVVPEVVPDAPQSTAEVTPTVAAPDVATAAQEGAEGTGDTGDTEGGTETDPTPTPAPDPSTPTPSTPDPVPAVTPTAAAV